MDEPETYAAKAEALRRKAEMIDDPRIRAGYLKLAEGWLLRARLDDSAQEPPKPPGR